MADNTMLEYALKYASVGYRVHPCRKNKTPLLPAWQEKASSDPEQIKAWWSDHPDASIGCACGPGSGFWVLDIDLPDGQANLERIIEQHGPLPETLEQTTGSGGKQLFFHYNNTEIRNSVGKIAKDIDVRGDGGYCILPPSPHPSGNNYKWNVKKKPAQAPDWLVELIKADDHILPITHTYKSSLYGKKALADEVINVSCAGEGTRNDTLNRAAYCIGQLVAGGCLDSGQAFSSLLGAAIASGVGQKEATATINSGFRSGASQPRTAPRSDDDKYYFDDEIGDNQQGKQSKQNHTESAGVSNGKQESATVSKSKQESADNQAYNLTSLITEYVKSSKGSFTTTDIDREFCLTTRREKNNRSRALNKLINNNYIYRDKKTNGKYHILDYELEVVDLEAPAEESFPIVLPFGIHKKVVIPPHSIIVLAGSSNAGKTAFILNALWENRTSPYGKLYLMSEMGAGEYITRIKKFTPNWKQEWKGVTAASRSYDFQGAIKLNNPDGITFVDYLEEQDGEYFKIASNIRDIYDALGTGVCFIAIQKKRNNEIGRGGEGTLEKSRLYLSLDHLAVGERSIICALKIVKLKNFIDKNLEGYEMHFRLSMGHKIDQLTDWMLSSRVDRDAYKRKYESEVDGMPEKVDPGDIFMKMKDGSTQRITEKTARMWQEEFNAVDVFEELRKISYQSKRRPFLTDKYIFQIRGLLGKNQKEFEQEVGA